MSINLDAIENLAREALDLMKLQMPEGGWISDPPEQLKSDASFIYHSRHAVPALAKAVLELSEKLRKAEDADVYQAWLKIEQDRDGWRGRAEAAEKRLRELEFELECEIMTGRGRGIYEVFSKKLNEDLCLADEIERLNARLRASEAVISAARKIKDSQQWAGHLQNMLDYYDATVSIETPT